MYIVIGTNEVINNWDNIVNDPMNNRSDIKNPYQYIHEAKKGRVTAGGYQIIISDKLPEFE